jgi:hypothetical protein
MKYYEWYLHAEEQENTALMASEVKLAEVLAHRDDSLRVKRANPARRDFQETNLKVV